MLQQLLLQQQQQITIKARTLQSKNKQQLVIANTCNTTQKDKHIYICNKIFYQMCNILRQKTKIVIALVVSHSPKMKQTKRNCNHKENKKPEY